MVERGGCLGGLCGRVLGAGGGARRWVLPLPDTGAKRPRRRGAGGAFYELGKLRFYLLEYSFYSTSRLFRKFCWIACARIFLIFIVP